MSNTSTVISLHKTDITNKMDLIIEKTYVGIDFGTSTTVVSLAYFNNERQIKTKTLILNQKLSDSTIFKSDKIPSMIAWHNNQLLVGEGAKEVRLKKTKDRNIWYSFKMDLGKKNDFLYSQSELSNSKIKLLNGRDATSIFFKYLYQQINKYIRDNNYPVNIEYSISIPASFEPNQRLDMIKSLEFNNFNFNEQAFIDEPNAAFLSYISDLELQKNIHLSQEYNSNILVFDYGAGTCDISILEVGLEGQKFTSSNLSISTFEFIGGKEIDKLIAVDILLPQLLKENEFDENYFTTRDLNNVVLPKLERYAELLKIDVCKSLNLQKDRIDENELYSLNTPILFQTRKGDYQLTSPSISFEEFNEIISIFTDLSESGTYRLNNNERFYSIYKPIKTALKKAKLSNNDIDYVLFVGGSAKNPLIRDSIKKFFKESDYLIPNDLQLHVSAGAAINSLLYNGFNENVVSPITNDSIYLLINGKDKEQLYPLFLSGSSLPSERIKISDLIPNSKTDKIELPICLGNKDKILYNLIIRGDKNFNTNDKIELYVHIDANRTIHCSAEINGITKSAIIENSLLSTEVNLEKVERAEYKFSKFISNNKGEETSSELYKLFQVYQEEDEHLKAAEIAEELNKNHNKVSLNNIGLIYRKAGNDDRAIHFYTKATEEEKSASSFFNLANCYKFIDDEKFSYNLKKTLQINPYHGLAKFELLRSGIDTSDSELLSKKLIDLFNEWKDDYENECFPYHISWLISCANLTENSKYAKKLEQLTLDNESKEQNHYNRENLACVLNKE
jgi:molecular chaperone DnaK